MQDIRCFEQMQPACCQPQPQPACCLPLLLQLDRHSCCLLHTHLLENMPQSNTAACLIRRFFEDYKKNENKEVKVDADVKGAEHAKKVVRESLVSYSSVPPQAAQHARGAGPTGKPACRPAPCLFAACLRSHRSHGPCLSCSSVSWLCLSPACACSPSCVATQALYKKTHPNKPDGPALTA